MKGLVLRISLVFAAVTFAAQAHAEILLEPYLGYYMGTMKQSGQPDDDAKGLGYGARVGYQTMGFMIGGEYASGSLKTETAPTFDVTPTELGVFVGYNFPVMLRVYGVYFFDSELKAKNSSGTYKYEGKNMKLGVGFTPLPLISVNLEYFTATYDKFDGQSLTPEMKNSGYGLSVSVPLTF